MNNGPLLQRIVRLWVDGAADTFPQVKRVLCHLPAAALLDRLHNTCEVARLPIQYGALSGEESRDGLLYIGNRAEVARAQKDGFLATHLVNDACVLLWGQIILTNPTMGSRAYALRRLYRALEDAT